MQGGKQGACSSAWGMFTPSLGKGEECSHLPVLDGACLYRFAAMGVLSLRLLKDCLKPWLSKGARWGKTLGEVLSQPCCM